VLRSEDQAVPVAVPAQPEPVADELPSAPPTERSTRAHLRPTYAPPTESTWSRTPQRQRPCRAAAAAVHLVLSPAPHPCHRPTGPL
jgi:hypothetical protein